MYKYDVYLAGPFFNDAQKARMDRAKAILIENGLTVADPRELGPVIVDSKPEEKTPEFFRKIFQGNINAMDDSFLMVASLDDKDIGTAFEIGYFTAMSKIIVSFAFDGGKTNVMLGQAVDVHFDVEEKFKSFFEIFSPRVKTGNAASILTALEAAGLKKAEADE